MKRVVITGIGAVTPIGNGKDELWKAVKEGVCGVDIISKFDASNFTCKIAAEVKDFELEKYIDKKEAKRMDKYSHYAVAAAKMAIENAKINLDEVDKERVGVILGVGVGGMETFETQCQILNEKGEGRVSPFFIPMMISNMGAGLIAIATGAKGPNETVTAACASGTNALGNAARLIMCDEADVVIAGGAEAAITPLSIAGFASMKALSTRNDDPKGASSPFDLNRDGFVMGEGAGILILEELEHAKARGANIVAEVLGYASTDDAYHITAPAPNGEGGARAMALAIKSAKLQPSDIDYINAHGTSTPYNDKFETAAIKSVLGEHAYKTAVSSTKGMTGHMLGAAGAVEAIICAMAVNEDFVPATINYKTPDPECDLDIVPNKGRNQTVNYAMSNSLGFGGHNSSIIIGKYK